MATTRKGVGTRVPSRELEEVRALYRDLFERLARMGNTMPAGIELVAETCHGGEFCHGGTTKSVNREELLRQRAAAGSD
jgi:hypothetical protein